MLLLEVRDLSTNELLTTYDVTGVSDWAGVLRAVETARPDTACTITVERDTPLGELTETPAPLPEDGTGDPTAATRPTTELTPTEPTA